MMNTRATYLSYVLVWSSRTLHVSLGIQLVQFWIESKRAVLENAYLIFSLKATT